MFSKICLGEMH